MRLAIQTREFIEFYESVSGRVQEKIDYIVHMMQELPTVHSKFIKKLQNTDYYEMRISVDNEYRVILFAVDNNDFRQTSQILLLNGFVKKSTKDYKAQLAIADRIIAEYYEKD